MTQNHKGRKTYKTPDAVRRHLAEQLAKAANGYALELHNLWNLPATPDDYWIGGEEHPAGAPYQMRTLYFITLDEMQYIVEHAITHDEYADYADYISRIHQLDCESLPAPGFIEWHRHPDRRIAPDRLEQMQMQKDEFTRIVDEEVERLREQSGACSDYAEQRRNSTGGQVERLKELKDKNY